MRNALSALVSLLALQALAPAQNNRHFFYVEEGGLPNRFMTRVNAATRVGGVNTAEVECLTDLSAAAFRGIGSVNSTTCRVTGQVHIIQDADTSTGDPYHIILRQPVAPDGLPDGTNAGIIARSGVLNLPVGAGGGGAWQITVTWQTPVQVPCETGFYLGVVLLPQTSSTDYTLTQTASLFTPGATPPGTATGDNPRQPAPKFHAVRVDQPSGTAVRSTTQRTLTMIALTDAPTVNVGNVDNTVGGDYTSFGLGGLYPAIKTGTRDDGLAVRIEDETNAGGVAAAFLSIGFLPGGFDVSGLSGAVWIDPTTLVLAAMGPIPAVTPCVFQTVMAPPGSIPAAAGVTLTFSALTFGNGGGRLANAQSTTL